MNYPTGNARNYQGRRTRDPKICGGDPIFKGMRVTLCTVLASLAEGDSPQRSLPIFPA